MLKARILNRYLFVEMLTPFFISLGVFLIILLLAKVIELTDMVVTRGVSLAMVGKLLLYSIPYFLVFTMPMATMLAVLLTFMRLSSDNEVTALKAAGVGLHQLVPPVAALAISAWLVCWALAVWAQPWANIKFENLAYRVASSRADLALKERVFLDHIKGLVIYINQLSGRGDMKGVFVVDERDPKRSYTVVAEKGRIFPGHGGKLTLRLFNGSINNVDKNLHTAHNAHFNSYDISMDIGHMAPGARKSKHRKELYVSELLSEMAKEKAGSKRYYELDMELQQKFALPFACLVMALFSLPLGVHWRGGRSWGIVIGLGVFVLYYMMLSMSWSLGEHGAYPPKLGTWMPNILLSILGSIMFYLELNEKPYPFSRHLVRLDPGGVWRRLRGSSAGEAAE